MALNAGDLIRCEIALKQVKGRDGKSFPACFENRAVPKKEMGRRPDHYDRLFAEWETMPILERIGHAALELHFYAPSDQSVNAKIIHQAYLKLCRGR
jgi:hypothetical protein